MTEHLLHSVYSRLPDKSLKFGMSLPWPANRLAFAVLRRLFQVSGRLTGSLTRIRFGDVEIDAPLNHPAVYWRYRPVGANLNYLAVVRQTLQLRRGLIIDVGANIGDGVALLRGYGVNAPIVAVEGTNSFFDLLKSNTRNMVGVKLEHVYLGSGDQCKNLAVDQHEGTARLIDGDTFLELRSLDDVIADRNDDPVALLKTDTDGFDAKVLCGAKRLLSEQAPVVFTEISESLLRQQGNSAAELLRFLADVGYHSIGLWDHDGRWLGSRLVSHGLADLIPHYPGDPGKPYLDAAVLTEADSQIMKRLMS
jgi:FkbM family methyltransferase